MVTGILKWCSHILKNCNCIIMYNILLIKLLCTTVLCLDEMSKDLLTPIAEYGEACGYQSCPEVKSDYLNVHIVPATHGELGGSRTFLEHYTGDESRLFHSTDINMKNILDSVITSLWTDRSRTFTLSDLTYLFYWWKDRDSTVRRMVYELIRQGRLYFAGGGWGMSDESTSHYHAIIDHYTYGLRKLNATFLECGRPLVTWQADTFGHSREFASLMAQMGFDGHFINPISYDDELARMTSRSLEFVWRGSDDLGAETDIFTHKLFDGYWSPPGFCFDTGCSDPLIITDAQFSNVAERIEAFTRQIVEHQSPFYTTNNVMVVMGQRMGYHDAKTWFSNIDTLIRTVNEAKKDTKLKLNLVYSTPACYLKEIKIFQPVLKTKQDDFFPVAYDKNTYYTGMFYGRPGIKYLARELHLYLLIAKQLQMFGHLKNNDVLFEDIQWTAGTILDHTIHTGGMQNHVNAYYTLQAHKAKKLCIQIIKSAFNKLRGEPDSVSYYACPLNVSSCWTISGDRSYIIIYNPLAWPVTLPVRLPVQRLKYNLYVNKDDTVEHSIISIPEFVKDIPERSLPSHSPDMVDELVFVAEKIPPMGYRSYYLEIDSSRQKREIIKKMTKNKKRKYLTRQTHSVKASDDNLINHYDDHDDDDYLEAITNRPTIIEFAKVLKSNEDRNDRDYILTPRSKINDTSPTTEVPDRGNRSNQIYLTRTSTESSTSERTESSTTSSTEKLTSHSAPISTIPTTTSTPSTTTTIKTSTNTPSPEYYDDEPSHKNTNDEENEEEVTWEQELVFRRLERTGYHSVQSPDSFIKNEYIKINLNQNINKISSISLSNGVIMNLDINMMYYTSDTKTTSAYIFRPLDPNPEFVSKHPSLSVLKSNLVQEVHLQFASYAGFALRLYKELPYIELEWRVGPIPTEDGYGKEIFIRYTTDLNNNDVFYTDSNGRQTIKRIKNKRYTHPLVNTDGISGNIYPVTSKVYIEDTEKNIRFSVFPDRGEGCTSLDEGDLDIMIHRRLSTDDNLNDTASHIGLVIRGKHRLYLSKADYKPNKFFEKKFAKELEIHSQIFTSTHPYYDPSISFTNWSEYRNEYSALNKKLPIGVHILSFEKWKDQLLIRLENYLESNDVVKKGVKFVNILGLFNDFLITSCKETMLGTNIWRSNYFKMEWQKGKFVKNFNDAYGNQNNSEFADDVIRQYDEVDLPAGIKLVPQQIRTFVCSYQLIGELA